MAIKAETLEAHVKVTGVEKARHDLDSLSDSAAGVGTSFETSGKQADTGAKRVDSAGSRMQSAMGGTTKAARAQAVETSRAGSSTERLGQEAERTAGALGGMGGGLRRTRGDADGAGKSIDKLSGRLRIIGDLIAILGPAAVPIGAVLVPAVTALGGALGFTAIGAGVLVGSMQGVGDALKAVNKAGIEPTDANLKAMHDAMAQLPPETRKFVRELHSLGGPLTHLRDIGAHNMMPGFTDGLEAAKGALPEVNRLVANYGAELGTLGAETGKSLASERWKPFLRFLGTEGPKGLDAMAHIAGNTGHALANMWMAFNPTNQGALQWLEDATRRLDEASGRVAGSAGFQEFINYVTANGPKVGALIASWSNAILQIAEAAAPVGTVVLGGLTAVAKVISAIADSDLGTPILAGVAALSLYNRAMATAASLQGRVYSGGAIANIKRQGASIRGLATEYKAYNAVTRTAQGRAQASAATMIRSREAAEKLRGSIKSTAVGAAKGAALIAGLAIATTGLGDKFGITNTASMALMGSMAGPWGAVIGGAIGLTMDLAHSQDNLRASLLAAQGAMETNNIDAMRTHLDDLNQTLKDRDAGFWNPKDTIKGFRELGGWLTGTTSKAKDMKHALEQRLAGKDVFGLGPALRTMQAGLIHGIGAANRQAAALRNARAAARETAGQFVNVGNAAQSAGSNLNKFIRTLNRQARDLQNFANNASVAANRGLRQGLIRQLQALGPAGATMLRKFANGTDAQITRANHAFQRGKEAIAAFIDATGTVPPTKGMKFQVIGAPQAKAAIRLMRDEIARLKDKSVHMNEKGAAAAKARIAALRAAIAALRDRTVNIHTRYSTSGSKPPPTGRQVTQAEGGQVVAGPGQSTGPKDDTIPALLSHREWVMPVAAVNRYGAGFMRAVQTGTFQAFARGGQARAGGHHHHHQVSAAVRADNNAVRNLAESIKAGAIKGIQAAADVMEKRMGGAAERGWETKFKRILTAAGNLAAINKALVAKVAQRDALVEAKANAKDAITSGIQAQANVLNAGNNVGTIRDSLATQLGKAKEFAANLQALRSAGYSSAVLEQVASAGIEGGAEVAKALLAGSKADVASINASFKGITDIANQTGTKLSAQMYDAGINAANGVISGLSKRKKAIEDYLTKVALGMERALKRALKIKSPSLVTDQIGQYVGAGLIRGMRRHQGGTLQASRNLARAAIKGMEGLGSTGGLASPQIGTRALTPGSLGVAPGQGNLHLEFNTYNPVAEPQSRTTNKALDRAASLSLV